MSGRARVAENASTSTRECASPAVRHLRLLLRRLRLTNLLANLKAIRRRSRIQRPSSITIHAVSVVLLFHLERQLTVAAPHAARGTRRVRWETARIAESTSV